MLRLQPKAKDRRKFPILAELRNAMAAVVRLIKEAKRDPDVVLDFGDAIQVGRLCGGRYQKKPSRFQFTYRPENEGGTGTWYLDLFGFDVEDIADGRLAEITMYCCLSPQCGAKFNKADGNCACDYIIDPDFGTFEFPEAKETLKKRGVAGISDDSTRDDVLAVLGPPDRTGGDVTDSLGYIWPWITYRRDDCQMRFEFGAQQRLSNVTVMKKDWEPGK